MTTNTLGAARQDEIYQEGAVGRVPRLPVRPEDLARAAQAVLDPVAWAFLDGGAGSESTIRDNRAAFERWRIVPRFLRDVSARASSLDLFGRRAPLPLLVAPIGVQELYHPDAELASARAAASLGVPFVLSCVSSRSLEEVSEVMGPAPRWFQLYWPDEPRLAASLIKRAGAAGYEAIVVTVDTFSLAWRERDLAFGHSPFLAGKGMANYVQDPVFRRILADSADDDPRAAIRLFHRLFGNPRLTWEDLAVLRMQTTLPIVVKGLLHPADALLALRAGVDALIVSNHGGRQMDGGIASLDALPAIVDAVAGRIPVLFDGGIRRGADAFKALALGAQAVLLGRPCIWGLALAGQEGVREVLRNFSADLDLTFALSGHASLAGLSKDALVRT